MIRPKPFMQPLRHFVRDLHSSLLEPLFPDLPPLLQTRHLKQAHAHIIVTGLIENPFASSHLLSSPALSPDYAHSIFEKIPHPNLFLWNTMLKKLVHHDADCIHLQPLLLYREMVGSGHRPNGHTFLFLIKGLATRLEIRGGEVIHSCVVKIGFGCSQFVSSALVGLYVSCGIVGSARKVFDEMGQPGLILWTAMVRAYVCSTCPIEALELFANMRMVGLMPDSVAMAIAISACGQFGDLGTAKMMHGFVTKSGTEVDEFVRSGLLSMYGDCGCLELAIQVFNDASLQENVVAWNAMINQCAKNNDMECAIQLFNKMPKRDVISWNTIIGNFSRTGRSKEALALFHKMALSDLKPNRLTMSIMLSACASLGALDTGIWLHTYIDKNRMNVDGSLDPGLIDMYSKCGSVERALQVFERVQREDLFSWTSIICGLAMHGHAKHALDLFSRMHEVGIQPDDVTFVGVLSACSHAGLLDQGYQYFHAMERVYGITPKIEHYGCMIDLLARMGHLSEAHDIIKKMPMKLNAVIWGSLLSSCRVHNDVQLADIAAARMVELDSSDQWARVMLSNIYAEAGKWDHVMRLRREIKEMGIKKLPGCSLIEVNGMVHEFLVGDNSHPRDCEIRFMLEKIETQLKMSQNKSWHLSCLSHTRHSLM